MSTLSLKQLLLYAAGLLGVVQREECINGSGGAIHVGVKVYVTHTKCMCSLVKFRQQKHLVACK